MRLDVAPVPGAVHMVRGFMASLWPWLPPPATAAPTRHWPIWAC
jgi:hypothetical protein